MPTTSTSGFEPSAAFSGARPGFVFKLGPSGLGYYPDSPPTPAATTQRQQEGESSVIAVQPAALTCHYEVLGVARDSTEAQIRQAYRRCALQCHPDRNSGDADGATERFQRVQAAYSVLSDPHERAWYDAHREAILSGARRGGSAAAGGTGDNPDEEPAEPEGIELWGYFSPAAFRGWDEGEARSFYRVYAEAFASLADEESALRGGDEARARADGPASSAAPPPFGGPSAGADEVDAFYRHWEAFHTRRVCACEDRYAAAQVAKAANKQQRKAMEAENRRRRAVGVRRRDECVRALVAYVKRRDPRAKARAAELERRRGDAPVCPGHEERVRRLREELAALEAEEEEEEEAEEAGVEDEEGEGGGRGRGATTTTTTTTTRRR